MLQFCRRFLLLVAFVLSLPSFALAQSADDKAMRAYTLDMAKLQKYVAAHEKLAAMIVAKPSLGTIYQDKADKEDLSMDELVKDFDKIPEFRSVMQSQGMTTRDYLMMTFVLLHVGLYREMKKMDPRTEMPYEVSPANVRFMETNAAEIEKLEARRKAAQAKIDSVAKKGKR